MICRSQWPIWPWVPWICRSPNRLGVWRFSSLCCSWIDMLTFLLNIRVWISWSEFSLTFLRSTVSCFPLTKTLFLKCSFVSVIGKTLPNKWWKLWRIPIIKKSSCKKLQFKPLSLLNKGKGPERRKLKRADQNHQTTLQMMKIKKRRRTSRRKETDHDKKRRVSNQNQRRNW